MVPDLNVITRLDLMCFPVERGERVGQCEQSLNVSKNLSFTAFLSLMPWIYKRISAGLNGLPICVDGQWRTSTECL